MESAARIPIVVCARLCALDQSTKTCAFDQSTTRAGHCFRKRNITKKVVSFEKKHRNGWMYRVNVKSLSNANFT